MNFKKKLDQKKVQVSVPCRVDLGGTLDISTFYLNLASTSPSTFNIALNMRTVVTLSPWETGAVKVSSNGFDSSVFEKNRASFHHPMGLMFADSIWI